MDAIRAQHGLELAEASPGVLASLARVDAMSDEQLRSLVDGEHPMMIEAAEAIIDQRRRAHRAAS